MTRYQIPEIKQINKIRNADVLVVHIRKKSNDFNAALKIFFPGSDDIKVICENHPFPGEKDSHQIHLLPKNAPFKALLLIGLGRCRKRTEEQLRKATALAVSKGAAHKWQDMILVFPSDLREKAFFAASVVQGIFYQTYRFEQFKSKAKKEHKRRVYIWNDEKRKSAFNQNLARATDVMHGIWTTKDLANRPPNHLTPCALKDFVKDHFRQFPNIRVLIKDRKALQKENFNLLLGVADGSAHEPYLIEINYRPRASKRHLALVGKGVTFDSGGLSLKPSGSMPEMKYDMAGAAAVVGIMDVVARQQPDVAISACIGAVENMTGARAYRPSDVIFGYAGKSVEVLNTDAEGRLVLADALAYTEKKHHPDYMIDFATLTGACYVALGDQYAGLFSNDKTLRRMLKASGRQSGDKLWPMPLDAAYQKSLKSPVADIKNIGDRWGGAITAARFLKFFISKTAWAHIDIAGVANDLSSPVYNSKNSSGFGVRLIVNLIQKLTALPD